MKIHEFQGKELLQRHGIPVPRGKVATSAVQAEMVAQALGADVVVVKAQIHAGGRGKGGGVKVVKDARANPAAVRQAAEAILGMRLVTPQTSPQGQKVKQALIEEGSDIAHEYYVGVVVDRARGCPVMMASSAGGMEIEEVAAKTPEKILRETVNFQSGLFPFQARRLAYGLGLTGDPATEAAEVFRNLATAFLATDASLAEINPLVATTQGHILALDAKFNFDDNALYRHKELAVFRDLDEEDPTETRASEAGLSYVKLDGEIGCMVNGAGLAMATMDIIKLAGSEPANFLDVGGSATAERVQTAFEIITSDPHVKAILVNIFGGIVKCDLIADGIVAAVKGTGLGVPLVVRLHGTRAEEGKRVLAESGLDIESAHGMTEAAEKVVKAARRKAKAKK